MIWGGMILAAICCVCDDWDMIIYHANYKTFKGLLIVDNGRSRGTKQLCYIPLIYENLACTGKHTKK